MRPNLFELRAARRRSPVPRPLRLAALAVALCLAWSLALAAPAQALADAHLSLPSLSLSLLAGGGLRQARALLIHAGSLLARQRPYDQGAQLKHGTTVSDQSGDTFPWEASVGGTNTGNGNKTITLPLVAWTARGGLPVSFALTHNSQSVHDSELGIE